MVLGEATFCIPLAGVVNIEAEASRLGKEVEKLQGEIDRLQKKLGNEKFVANAPASIVEEEQNKLNEYQQQQDRVREAWNRVKAAG